MTKQISTNPVAGALSAASPLYSTRILALMGTLLLVWMLVIPPAQAQESPATTGSVTTVNINTDDASTLADGLSGVGLSRAEDIVRYREEFGPFTTVEQLSEVKGIGKATLDKNRARITLD